MRPNLRGWPVVGLTAALSLLIIGTVKWRGAALRIEVASVEVDEIERMALQRRQAELRKDQISGSECDRLRASGAKWRELRAELDALKAAGPGPVTHIVQPEEKLSAIGFMKAASDWQNVGRATPAANLETALWAAAGGDVDTLAGLITFHDTARAKAETVLAEMPAEMKAKYDSPEKWAAFFTVQDVPTAGTMRVMAEYPANEHEMRLGVLFFNDHGSPEERRRYDGMRELAFRPDADGWKLVVPASAVEAYAAMLKGVTTAR